MAHNYILVRVANRGPYDIYHELAADGTRTLCGQATVGENFALKDRHEAARRGLQRCRNCNGRLRQQRNRPLPAEGR